MNVSQFLPAVDSPKSIGGMIYGVAVPVVIGYAVFADGMPEKWHEWLIAGLLLIVAVGFAINLFTVQFAAATAGGSPAVTS